jgi:succinoglycan biosynthesis protein ExoM
MIDPTTSGLQISVCVCTLNRPVQLVACLDSLAGQRTARRLEIIVIDNSAAGSARPVADRARPALAARGIDLAYQVEPERNIALARNRAVAAARAPLIAFLDDDETVVPEWIEGLARTLDASAADAVFGPVTPDFAPHFPAWQQACGVFDRPRHVTGQRVGLGSARTGNVLLRRSALAGRTGPFQPRYGRTGGEDSDLFEWMALRGGRFTWCDEAVAREWHDLGDASWSWHLRRAYRGGWCYSCRLAQNHRRLPAAVLSLGRVAPALVKATVMALTQLGNPRGALLRLMVAAAGQAGKAGYFMGVRLERPEVRPEAAHSPYVFGAPDSPSTRVPLAACPPVPFEHHTGGQAARGTRLAAGLRTPAGEAP